MLQAKRIYVNGEHSSADGGSFFCCSNFPLNLSPKLFCSLRKEVVVTTFSCSLFSACLLSLHFYHEIITSFHKATLSNEKNQSTIPSSLLSLSTNLSYWGCVLRLSPFFNHSCPKIHLPSPIVAAYSLPRCSL